MHTCYKIYGYFEFQFSHTNDLSSVVHSATLIHSCEVRQSGKSSEVLLRFFPFLTEIKILFMSHLATLIKRSEHFLLGLCSQNLN